VFDVVAGSTLGFGVAWAMYRRYFPLLGKRRSRVPYVRRRMSWESEVLAQFYEEGGGYPPKRRTVGEGGACSNGARAKQESINVEPKTVVDDGGVGAGAVVDDKWVP
jgi:hypothetical protein